MSIFQRDIFVGFKQPLQYRATPRVLNIYQNDKLILDYLDTEQRIKHAHVFLKNGELSIVLSKVNT